MLKKTGLLTILHLAVAALALYPPVTCYGAEFGIQIEVSPNIINIASNRWGEIRILTNMKYSTFTANGGEAFIYFNDSEESVDNIRATRDSLGNLILKFELGELLVLEASLVSNALNHVMAIVVYQNGDEYIGFGEVYLTDKKAQ